MYTIVRFEPVLGGCQFHVVELGKTVELMGPSDGHVCGDLTIIGVYDDREEAQRVCQKLTARK